MIGDLPPKRYGGIDIGRSFRVKGKNISISGGDMVDVYVETMLVKQAEQPAFRGQLPIDMPDFTGRDAELRQLESDLMATGGQRVVICSITGMPGVGKSSLAVHLAHRVKDRFPDGQIYVPLRGADHRPVSAEVALTELLQRIGVPSESQPSSLEGKATLWRQQIDGKRVLIVLDNVHDEEQVWPLIPGSPTCGLIMTSREKLTTPGIKSLSLRILEPDEALELMSKIAGPERIAAEQNDALEVRAACGGLPLALRIAGAKLRAHEDWSVAKLAGRLTDERRRLAELGMGDLDVRASFQLSYEDLDDDQARLFRHLSLWPGPDFHLWAAAALQGVGQDEAEYLLDRLVEVRLIDPLGVGGRYQMHDLLRLFAREHLNHESEGNREAVRLRLLEAALGVAVTLHLGLRSGLTDEMQPRSSRVQPEAALNWLEAERDGLVGLAGQTAERGPWPVVWQLAELLSEFLGLRGYWADEAQMHRWALQAARRVRDRAATGRAHGSLGGVLARQGHWQRAIDQYKKSLSIVRKERDRSSEGRTLTNLGIVLAYQGHWQRAIDCYQQALAIARELEDRQGQAYALINLALVLVHQTRFEQATDHYQQSLAIFQELGDRHGQALVLGNLGTVLIEQGQWHQAVELQRQSLEIKQELGDRHGEAQSLNNLGLALASLGRWQEARDCYQSALAMLREFGDRQGESETLNNLGLVLANQRLLDEAIECHRQDLLICEELGDRHGRAQALNNLGYLLAERGQIDRAIDHYRAALSLVQALGDRHGEAQTLRNLGVALTHMGQLDDAIDLLQQSLAMLRELGDRHGEGQSLNNLGLALVAQRNFDQAISCYRQDLAICQELGDRHGEAQTLNNLGVAFTGHGDPEQAIDCHEQALAITRTLRDRHGEAQSLSNLGTPLAQRGHRRRARESWRAALCIFEQLGAPEADAIRRALKQLGPIRHRWWLFRRSRKLIPS